MNLKNLTHRMTALSQELEEARRKGEEEEIERLEDELEEIRENMEDLEDEDHFSGWR